MKEIHRYRDESLSIDDRQTAYMSEMTTSEKATQPGAVWASLLVRSPEYAFNRRKAKPHLEYGIGQISRLDAVSVLPPTVNSKLANRVQKFLVDETRLGIPAMLRDESCAANLAKGSMIFPRATLGARPRVKRRGPLQRVTDGRRLYQGIARRRHHERRLTSRTANTPAVRSGCCATCLEANLISTVWSSLIASR